MRKGFRPSSLWQVVVLATACSLLAAAIPISLDGGPVGIATATASGADKQTLTLETPRSKAAAGFDSSGLTGPTTLRMSPALTLQRNWAVIAGVSDYLYITPDLNYADDDAQDIYNRLTGKGWQSANIRLLTNSQATKANIQSAINWMRNSAGSQDLCLFFFSGHGGYGPDVFPIDEADGYDEYICPHDSLTNSWANDIRDDELDAWLSPISARKVVILDTCFSGGFIRAAETDGAIKAKSGMPAADITDGFAKDVDKAGFVAMTASAENELSYEYSSLQNGVFTYWVDQGLSGSADVNRSGVSAEEAFNYARPRVQNRTGGEQNPQLWDGIAGEVILTFYTLTVSSTSGGSVTEPGLGTFTYNPGTVVHLLAVANTGYKFVNWTGYVGTVADPDSADTTITMNGNYNITANFTLIRPPTVATDAATDVTASSATLNGTLHDLGSSLSGNVSFQWGKTTDYGNETPPQTVMLPMVFNGNLSDLAAGTTYHFRAKAVGDSTVYGNDMTFTTVTMPPTVIANAVGNITTNSATLNGTLDNLGTASLVTVSFEWGNSTSYGNETSAQIMNTTGAFSGNLTDLEPDTTYYFRAKAVGDGTAYGDEASFKTYALFQILLKAGWNLVSVPVVPSDNSVGAVFPGVAAIYSWDPVNKHYTVPATIEPDMGYLVAVTEDMTITIVGTPVTNWTTELSAGWNIIGSVFTDVSISDSLDDPDGSVQPLACWWDPVARHYIYTTDIEPGRAYLIAATQDCTLTVSNP